MTCRGFTLARPRVVGGHAAGMLRVSPVRGYAAGMLQTDHDAKVKLSLPPHGELAAVVYPG